MLTRLLIIGLDAMDKDLIQRWAAAGKLPTFRRLLERGLCGVTQNAAGLEAGGVWPSFYTGVSPSRHGMYYAFGRFVPETYEERLFAREDFTGETFWDQLSRENLRFAILDAPYSFTSKTINGVHLVDWGVHAPRERPHLGFKPFRTSPPEVAAEIEQRFGLDRIGNDDFVKLRDIDDYRCFRRDLINRVDKKIAITNYLLDKGGWDCVLTVFHDAHAIGHRCWHLHDPNHPAHDPAIAQVLGDPVEDVYVAIDRAIGALLDKVGPETTTLVYTSHGMGPNYSASRLLDQILLRWEGIVPPQNAQKVARVLHHIWDRTPRRVQEALAPARARLWQKGVKRRFVEVDRGKRKCFEVKNNDATGGIRLNVVGRERHGMIRPGSEYDAFCDRLIEDLLAITDEVSGQPLVKRVYRTSEIHAGPRMADLPDLLVDWNRDSPIRRVVSPRIGSLDHIYQLQRTGDHRPEGMFFAAGPAIEPRRLNELTSVNDFAPTIASMLGKAMPRVDGAPIPSLVAQAAAPDRFDG